MTTDVMEAPDESILGQNQEDRVGADVVAIVCPNHFKPIAVCEAVPSLKCQRESPEPANTCENIARVSNAKKFSLVYQELGKDARSSIWCSNDDLLDVALSDGED
jgi:hypothetical protein